MRLLTLSSLVLSTSGLLLAQETVTVSTGPSNADQVFYSLRNGEQATVPLADWDLAFEVPGVSSSILVNTAKGNKVYHAGSVEDWDAVTEVDVDNWAELQNSETDWSRGALSQGADNVFNLGWGIYSIQDHTVTGTKLFAVQVVGGPWKKLRINGLSSGVYSFTCADLDGDNEQTYTLAKTAFPGKAFGYWDLTTNASVDREPAAAEWDLLFTKYLSDLGVMWYSVAGVLHNKDVETAQLDGVDTGSVSFGDAEGHYGTDINIIGSDWKTFDLGSFEYIYPDDRAYFVKAVDGTIWKLIFTGYGGSATGTMTFTKEQMGTTSVDDLAGTNGQVVVHPNPATNGQVQLVLDLPVDRAVVNIHDMNGRVVFADRFGGLTPLAVRTLDLNGIRSGAYVVRVEHAMGMTSSRLIIVQ